MLLGIVYKFVQFDDKFMQLSQLFISFGGHWGKRAVTYAHAAPSDWQNIMHFFFTIAADGILIFFFSENNLAFMWRFIWNVKKKKKKKKKKKNVICYGFAWYF